MKKRKKIFQLLDKLSGTRQELPKVVIKGVKTGCTLYEGGLLYVPFCLCSDYVFQYEESGGVLTIICSPC